MAKIADQETGGKIPTTTSIATSRARATASPAVTPRRQRAITIAPTPHFLSPAIIPTTNYKPKLKSKTLISL
ncbi:hypothetical protein ACFXTI_040242 [Malus domestica]